MEHEAKQEKEILNHEIEELKRTLPVDHLKFVNLYLAGHSAVDAFELSGLGDKISATAQHAKKLLRTPKIKLYIDAVRRRVSERAVLDLEAVDQHLTDIATTDLTDILNVSEIIGDDSGKLKPYIMIKDTAELTAAQKASIKEIIPTENGLIVKMHDKVKALDMLVKRRAGYKEVHEHSVEGQVTVFAMPGNNGRGPIETK